MFLLDHWPSAGFRLDCRLMLGKAGLFDAKAKIKNQPNIFFTAFLLCILRSFKLETEGHKYTENLIAKLQNANQNIFPFPGLAPWLVFKQPGPGALLLGLAKSIYIKFQMNYTQKANKTSFHLFAVTWYLYLEIWNYRRYRQMMISGALSTGQQKYS